MTQDPFVTLTSPENEKTFEHAITLAAAFVANGKVPYYLDSFEGGKTTRERDQRQQEHVSDLIHTMYGAVLRAREMIQAGP